MMNPGAVQTIPARRARILRTDKLRRAFRTQIAAALAQLKGAKPADVNVHSARKWIKKARATVRLMRDVLGEATYRRENAALRDAARELSAARDLKVLIEALDRLEKRSARRSSCATALRRILVSERDQLQKRSGSARRLASSRSKLRSVSERALEWSTARDDDAKLILHALRRIYRRGRRGLAASREPTTANLHEWRKEAKYLWHQLELMKPLAPRKLGTLIRRLHKLSDVLGEDHDLAMLSEKAHAHTAAFERTELRALLRCIDQRRESLQSRAFALGKRSYKKKPVAFIRSLETR
jgi:CHAD domain-containing protein